MWSAPIPAKDADGRPCNMVGAAMGARRRAWGAVWGDAGRVGWEARRPASHAPPAAQRRPASPWPHAHAPARPPRPAPPRPQLLVDCEGIDAVDQGQKHSAQIFSLAVLLSSVFVYNQVRGRWGRQRGPG
jgi:hypothetical protein